MLRFLVAPRDLLSDFARVVAAVDPKVAAEELDHGQERGGLAVGDRGGLHDAPAVYALGGGELPEETRLPTPGSPTTATTWPCPGLARSRASRSSSALRPTKRVSPRRAAASRRVRAVPALSASRRQPKIRSNSPSGKECSAKVKAKIDGPLQRLACLGQMLHGRHRLLEAAHRLPVGRSAHCLGARLTEVRKCLLPHLASHRMVGQPLDVLDSSTTARRRRGQGARLSIRRSVIQRSAARPCRGICPSRSGSASECRWCAGARCRVGCFDVRCLLLVRVRPLLCHGQREHARPNTHDSGRLCVVAPISEVPIPNSPAPLNDFQNPVLHLPNPIP